MSRDGLKRKWLDSRHLCQVTAYTRQNVGSYFLIFDSWEVVKGRIGCWKMWNEKSIIWIIPKKSILLVQYIILFEKKNKIYIRMISIKIFIWSRRQRKYFRQGRMRPLRHRQLFNKDGILPECSMNFIICTSKELYISFQALFDIQ